jgi:N-acetylglucosaminyldiphosphoundecaprenol N-acetyl-beta-D-mannosaminyltransferase
MRKKMIINNLFKAFNKDFNKNIEIGYLERDFQRDAYCLFGIAADNVDMAHTRKLINYHASQKDSIVLSTINVNWITRSFFDPQFRSAILNSDIVTIDGQPLLWLSKLFCCSIRQKVSGSTLVQELIEEKTENPITIFLFGGDDNTADLALKMINKKNGGLRAVGALNPGYGTVEEMSTDEIINAINRVNPDLLLVALGAKKGVQWIEKNRKKLNARIISHLGATINFLAGKIKRAPTIIQNFGFEWLWRITQEPELFFRYAKDGKDLFLVILKQLPLLLEYRCLDLSIRKKITISDIKYHETLSDSTITFGRYIQAKKDPSIRQILIRATLTNKKINLDFKNTQYVDNAFLGLLLIMLRHHKINGNNLNFFNINRRLQKFFYLFRMQISAGKQLA